ncbi:MAG: acyl carrier protein [Burkholderiales bacterium]|nr:acyl carrier protein [Anaerolineae bacterium]
MHISIPTNSSLNQMVVWLTKVIAKEKQVAFNQIDSEAPFAELGLDSMSAVTLSGELGTALDIELAPTLFWDYPNIVALAQYLSETVGSRTLQHN